MKTDLDLLRYVLPSGILDYFELVDGHFTDIDTHLFLDEQPLPPTGGSYTSKGFTKQRVIQDFPLRGKPVFLHIRRRKWLNIQTEEVVTSQFDLTHLGTQLSQEFADFFKGAYRD